MQYLGVSGKEEERVYKSSDSIVRVHDSMVHALHNLTLSQRSPRMIPEGISPVLREECLGSSQHQMSSTITTDTAAATATLTPGRCSMDDSPVSVQQSCVGSQQSLRESTQGRFTSRMSNWFSNGEGRPETPSDTLSNQPEVMLTTAEDETISGGKLFISVNTVPGATQAFSPRSSPASVPSYGSSPRNRSSVCSLCSRTMKVGSDLALCEECSAVIAASLAADDDLVSQEHWEPRVPGSPRSDVAMGTRISAVDPHCAWSTAHRVTEGSAPPLYESLLGIDEGSVVLSTGRKPAVDDPSVYAQLVEQLRPLAMMSTSSNGQGSVLDNKGTLRGHPLRGVLSDISTLYMHIPPHRHGKETSDRDDMTQRVSLLAGVDCRLFFTDRTYPRELDSPEEKDDMMPQPEQQQQQCAPSASSSTTTAHSNHSRSTLLSTRQRMHPNVYQLRTVVPSLHEVSAGTYSVHQSSSVVAGTGTTTRHLPAGSNSVTYTA